MSEKKIKDFSFNVPIELVKGSDEGDTFKVAGIASTGGTDKQNEVVDQDGIDTADLSIINWNHQNDPKNILGTVTKSKFITHNGKKALYVEGELFKHHEQAKAVYGILKSLKKEQAGFIGWSIEGSILQRDMINKSKILKCKLNAVALTQKPVNGDTYANIMKSMDAMQEQIDNGEVEFKTDTELILDKIDNLEKTISAGAGYESAPSSRTQGEAMATESMDKKVKKVTYSKKDIAKKKKKMKKMVKKAIEQFPDMELTQIVKITSKAYDKLLKKEKSE